MDPLSELPLYSSFQCSSDGGKGATGTFLCRLLYNFDFDSEFPSFAEFMTDVDQVTAQPYLSVDLPQVPWMLHCFTEWICFMCTDLFWFFLGLQCLTPLGASLTRPGSFSDYTALLLGSLFSFDALKGVCRCLLWIA